MRIPLDRRSAAPLYKQIESYFRECILSGRLPPDSRLPASRQLARDLGVNRVTVETAYAGLETDGLIFSRLGSGSYVLPQPPPRPIISRPPDAPWPLWQADASAPAGTAKRMSPEAMLKESRHKRPINFADGVGDPRLFPVDEFRKALQTVIRRDGTAALGYVEHNGYRPLRETIAQVLASQGVSSRAESILITSGSQQALAITAQSLLKPNDVVLVENPTYAGALDLFRGMNLKIVGAPMDENGMKVERLESLLQQYHPKLVYIIPNFHNPTGVCLSAARRRQLIELADRYNVPILEDDYVGDLRYEGRAQPALKSLDPGGRVIYVSTFSKMLMPGLRVGFLAAEGPIYEKLAACKRLNDLGSSNLIQRALEAYVTVGRYQAHLRRSCLAYRKRRDAMAAAIARYLPTGIRAATPQGGFFVWLELPGRSSAERLLSCACENGVAFACGSTFYMDGAGGERFIRLNFAAHPPEEIEEGIKRLGKLKI